MSIKEESLAKQNWAVVGATDKQNKFGYKIVNRLKQQGYSVFPVNPNLEEVAGLECYAQLADIPAEIEVVDLVVNPQIGLKVMEEIIELAIDYLWLQPGARSEELRERASKEGINLIEGCIYAVLS
ncbi:CoA-binding protein [Fuchsiella alkaliacetigena]|uniref:CoA-binding protein n=1 Tax=Fuchsiella alkaliacetigena TaxID=957042 RepID=UPI00200B6DAE|nr:CoA-binding protein [Fuchsiella alkaliacetigena]MCK8823626.1 CoA-binding protein [Fuchsiella alkaliacetigena]